MTTRITARSLLPSLVTVVVIPFCVFLLLALCSFVTKGNVVALLLFWFFICPSFTLFLSSKILKERHRVWKALVSLVVFYAFMVFMIYKHFESDVFAVMMLSFVWNALIMVIVILTGWDDERVPADEGNFS